MTFNAMTFLFLKKIILEEEQTAYETISTLDFLFFQHTASPRVRFSMIAVFQYYDQIQTASQ